MKTNNSTKLSRKELKDVFGGTLYPALECYSDRDCGRFGEAMVRCSDGTTSMTNYGCMNGKCQVNTGFCPPIVLLPLDPIEIGI
ncbi:hypothetical protein M2347_001727 [Chryseobacterium sp. H1D6B]|uniref:hypothetical protein n=1 Tax=Chryseobacterium sp. H1D6B TaxID=2940588 RepID=UPI0015CEB9CB|nr:hypothetical protein [Chryseobacterium sp. H1D6B]MDH6252000.1 hypothetical protein [Chryseobacterium sp. H1D6B]